MLEKGPSSASSPTSPSANIGDSAGATAPKELPRVVKAVRTSAPPVPPAIKQRALETTAKYVQMARRLYNRNFPMPPVAFDLRGKTAGYAYLGRNLVRYNAVLLTENEEEFLDDTVPHEVAHLIAHQLYGSRISAHGAEWKAVMRSFGVAPSRTHSFDTTNSAVGGTHRFTCRCGTTHDLSSRRKKKAQAGRLICKRCGSTLTLVGSSAGYSGLPPAPPPVRPPAPRVQLPVRAPVFAPPVARPPVPPVRPPTPGLPSPGAPRPATPAMLQFALVLAHRLGIALQPEHTASFAACSAFIERHKVAEPKGSPPSERQLQYARDIARRRGLTLAADVMGSASRLSAWISSNR